MAHTPQTMGSAVKQFEDYIEPDYEVGTGYASPAEIRGEVNAFVNSVLHKHLGGDNGTKPIANAYAFNSHLGQAMRYFDAGKDELVKAILAAHCTKKRKAEHEEAK